jgi:hypothetical protein
LILSLLPVTIESDLDADRDAKTGEEQPVFGRVKLILGQNQITPASQLGQNGKASPLRAWLMISSRPPNA